MTIPLTLARVQEATSEMGKRRLDRFTSLTADILNSMLLNGTLTQTGPGTFDLDGVAVTISNVDGSLIIAPTTGDVIASLDTNHANLWTAQQTFSKLPLSVPVNDTFAFTLTEAVP